MHPLHDAVLDGEALPRYERAIAIFEQQLGANHPATATSWLNLAAFYHQIQRPAEALTAIQRAVAIYTQTLGTDHPATQTTLSWLKTIRAAHTPSFPLELLLNTNPPSP